MRYELPPSQDRAIWDIWLSMHHLPAMAVADELGILQALEEGPATAEEMAQRLNLNGRATGVLFTMLAALGLTQLLGGRHELADVSRTYLLRQSPFYWGPLLRSLGVLQVQRAALIRVLKATDDDVSALPAHLPASGWSKGVVDRAQAESVSRIMHCHSLPAAVAVARSGKLEGVNRLLDVGGGSGCFSIAIAQHLPGIRCAVMELAAVCEVTRVYIEEGGVSDRVETVQVNMFHEEWPRGYDVIFLSNVFHDWNAETNLLLARRAYDALARGGRIILHEMLLTDDGTGPLTSASFSMLMLFSTQGRQYSFAELRQILANTGFIEIEADVSCGYFSLVVGRKP